VVFCARAGVEYAPLSAHFEDVKRVCDDILSLVFLRNSWSKCGREEIGEYLKSTNHAAGDDSGA